MALWRAVALSCLFLSSVSSIDEDYDPGYHGPKNADHDLAGAWTGFGTSADQIRSNRDGYGAGASAGADRGIGNGGDSGDNQWTPIAGPSGGDRVYVDSKGSKTLVASSPTSPVAEAINFNPPPPPPLASPPLRGPQYGASFHKSYQPPPPLFQSNVVHPHEHSIPTKTIINKIPIPVPQPYKVYIDKKVPFEVKVPVSVPVSRPVHVPVPRPVSIPVDKPYQVVVQRQVPYEIRVPVEVPFEVPYPVDVPQPYPVPVPVPKPILVKHPVPVVIKIIKAKKSWW